MKWLNLVAGLLLTCDLVPNAVGQVGGQISITPSTVPDGMAGVTYSLTFSAYGGTAPYTWSLFGTSLPPGLTLSTSGVISGTPSQAGGPFQFAVRVVDTNGQSAVSLFTLTIAPGLTVIVPPGLSGAVGVAFSTTFSASNGSPPYTWSVQSGVLPPGLALSSNGTLDGTPTQGGSFGFVVQVVDSSYRTASGTANVTIAASLSITTPQTLKQGTVGVFYSNSLQASGGVLPYSWYFNSGNLPPGLNLNAGGTLTGTPTQAGQYSLSIGVRDTGGSQATGTFALTVTPALQITTTSPLPDAAINTVYTTTLTAGGGIPPYTWTLGSTGYGLSLGSTSGVLSGTPTQQGTLSLTISVRDSTGANAQQTFSLLVAGALTVSTVSLPNGTVGAPYAQSLSASGGTKPYTWLISVGIVPPGLSLSAAGSLAGTPSKEGDSTFTVSVKDATATVAVRQFKVTIAPKLVITTTSPLANGSVGVPYSAKMTSTGGNPPLTWSHSGDLPPGLSMDSNGNLSGTPTSRAAAAFTATVNDATGATDARPLTLTISAPGGSIDTLAGTGTPGFSGDGGAGTAAQIDTSYAVAVDSFGNLYVSDTLNHRVRKVGTDGTITTIAGTGQEGFSGDGGLATLSTLSFPRGLATDSAGNLYISDSGNYRVRKLSSDGKLSTFAGNGQDGYSGDGGQAASAQLRMPRGLAADALGNVYIADSWNYRLRRVDRNGVISTIAGTGQNGVSGDGGPAVSANIGFIQSVAVDDGTGTVYISDALNAVVRTIDPNGNIRTFAGSTPGFGGDGGDATKAQFNYPRGIAVDPAGSLYIADCFNNRIRRIANGTIATVAGTGAPGFSGDSGVASQAQLNCPYGLATDPRGNVFIVDLANYRARKARFELVSAAPVTSSTSVVNAASFQQPVAPGSLITIFGSSFAARTSSAAILPLPTALSGTTVSIGGVLAPLVYVSPGQINAQLPAGISPGQNNLQVNFGGVVSQGVSCPVSATAPGVFYWQNNLGIITNQDQTLNTTQNAALRGSSITIYGTGAGSVSPLPADGNPPDSRTLSKTPNTPTVSFGGVQQTASFSGLAPGFVGLWQINVTVPSNAPVGNAVQVLVSLSGATSAPVTMAIR
jgi:uncharacterized protein (TIGR03437 family)